MLDLGRRLGAIRTRLVSARGRLIGAVAQRRHQSDVALRSCASRLESLSPLAVLGRGYAVCVAADGRTVLRDAAAARDGDTVHVRLEHGRLACTVTAREAAEAARPTRPTTDG